MVSARPIAVAYAARRYRLRFRGSAHHLRDHWREGLDIQRRDSGGPRNAAAFARRRAGTAPPAPGAERAAGRQPRSTWSQARRVRCRGFRAGRAAATERDAATGQDGRAAHDAANVGTAAVLEIGTEARERTRGDAGAE